MTELITRMNEAMPLGYQLAFLIRVLVATLCGGAIGLERTKRLKEAGIRTHCLVCCASALIMIVSKYAFADLSVGDAFLAELKRMDVSVIGSHITHNNDGTVNYGLTIKFSREIKFEEILAFMDSHPGIRNIAM